MQPAVAMSSNHNNGKHRKKGDLPSKSASCGAQSSPQLSPLTLAAAVCVHCQRPFNWRKKWEACWDEVKFCSDRCRNTAKAGAKASPAGPVASQGRGQPN